MKLVIAGGLKFVPTEKDWNIICQLVIDYNITEIISGCAKGADQFGEDCAKLLNIPVKHFHAKWDELTTPGAVVKQTKYGKSYNAMAGPDRNEQMALYTDYVHTFSGDKGTKNMRQQAVKYNKPLI